MHLFIAKVNTQLLLLLKTYEKTMMDSGAFSSGSELFIFPFKRAIVLTKSEELPIFRDISWCEKLLLMCFFLVTRISYF